MQLIVITPPAIGEEEIKVVHRLFEEGLEYLHLRKPDSSQQAIEDYIKQVEEKYYDRLVLHQNYDLAVTYKLGGIHISRVKGEKKAGKIRSFKKKHKNLRISDSWHRLSDVYEYDGMESLAYIFLSPVFDSISKKGYEAAFERGELENALAYSTQHIIALGGVDAHNIKEAAEIGFDGVASLGAVWTGGDPVENFKSLKKTCEKIKSLETEK